MFKKLMIVIPLVILFASFSALGQSDPCKPDCPNSEWSDPSETIDVTIPNCPDVYTITYRYRFACNTWYDFILKE
jgi:hypothetical protein